jgi:hypothetical protein
MLEHGKFGTRPIPYCSHPVFARLLLYFRRSANSRQFSSIGTAKIGLCLLIASAAESLLAISGQVTHRGLGEMTGDCSLTHTF